MTRTVGRRLSDIFQKISSRDLVGAELQENRKIYRVFGFLPACEMVDNALLISNIGYLLAQKGFNTCILDLKVFYPNLFYFLEVEPPKKECGLIRVLKSDRVDFRDEIRTTPYERLYLLSPSPYDLFEEYFDFDFEHLDRVMATLKQMFDLVLVDIPNNPPLEFCLGAIKNCHIGFFTATERLEAAGNMMKLMDFAASVGISPAKFSNVIFMNVQQLNFDRRIFAEAGLRIVASLPLAGAASALALEGKLYMKDAALVSKPFKKGIERIVNWIASDQTGGDLDVDAG